MQSFSRKCLILSKNQHLNSIWSWMNLKAKNLRNSWGSRISLTLTKNEYRMFHTNTIWLCLEIKTQEEGEDSSFILCTFFISHPYPSNKKVPCCDFLILNACNSICRERPAVMRRHYGYEPNSKQNSSSWVRKSKDMLAKSYW